MTGHGILLALAAAVAGVAGGRLHFRLLKSGTEALVRGGSGGRAVALAALRFGVTLGLFVLAAIAGGAAPLLAAALGFAIGRALELRIARSGTE